jgi:hypothetical protein
VKGTTKIKPQTKQALIAKKVPLSKNF